LPNLSSVCSAQLLAPDPLTVLRLLLLAPLLEEWIMRAGLQEWLMRRYPKAPLLALLAPAAVFSLLHLGAGPWAAAAVFAPGFALGLLYLRRRDWRLCALLHAFFNLFALTACGLALYSTY
jgi:membrane protease YdiL (CAAX protease family)